MDVIRYRPLNDWWQSDGRRFDSTSELLAADLPEGAAATYHFQDQPDTDTAVVSGSLREVAGHLFFAPAQSLDLVDLSLYQAAEQPPEPELPPRPVWQDRLEGAAAGAVLPVSTLIPIAGVFLPASIAAGVGKRVGGRKGGLVGAATGVAATVGTVVLGQAGLVGLAAASALSAAAGAVAGPLLVPRMRRWSAHVEQVKDQWWAPYCQDYDLKPPATDPTRRQVVEMAAASQPAGTGVVEEEDRVQVGGVWIKRQADAKPVG